MNKIVFSLILAVLSMGCSDTIVIVYPEDDAAMDADGGMDMLDSTQVLPDASVTPDATVTADAGMDAVVPDVCTGESDCCHNGQPIRVGNVCGDYPDSADAVCNSVGVCAPQVAQTCFDTNACCDGWSPIFETFSAPCHCEVDLELDHPVTNTSPYYRGCKNLPNEGAGNAAGHCGTEYPGGFGGHVSQYTCISNTTWTP